jgi:hypothetical protein
VVIPIQPAGGVVDLIDGVSLRVLPGTVAKPTMADAAPVLAEPGGVRVALLDGGELLKDVELAFRYPEAARQSPTRPVFYVVRTFLAAGGEIRSSTVDYAHVEGSGREARVVSASSPSFGHRWHRGAAEYAEPGGSVVCGVKWPWPACRTASVRPAPTCRSAFRRR